LAWPLFPERGPAGELADYTLEKRINAWRLIVAQMPHLNRESQSWVSLLVARLSREEYTLAHRLARVGFSNAYRHL
jgi:hypothetical protein